MKNIKVGDFYVWTSHISTHLLRRSGEKIIDHYNKGSLHRVRQIIGSTPYFDDDNLAMSEAVIIKNMTPCREYVFLTNLKQIT